MQNVRLKIHADPPSPDILDRNVHAVHLAEHIRTNNLFRGSLIDDPAVLERDNIIRVTGGEINIMNDKNYRLAPLISQSAQHLHNLH
ncbi:hypothetical protein D3C71_1750690 [compost metagenome]